MVKSKYIQYEMNVYFQVHSSLSHNPSMGELDIDINMKVSNYEDTVRQLDIYYGLGESSHYVFSSAQLKTTKTFTT